MSLVSAARSPLGEAIRWAYQQAGLKQSDVAKALHVHQTMVSQWTVGRVEPSLDQIRLIEQFCRVQIGAVLARAGYVSVEAALDHVKQVFRAGSVVPDLSRQDVREIMNLALPEHTKLNLVAHLQGDKDLTQAVG